jgi:GT2 family glycosyltransferase
MPTIAWDDTFCLCVKAALAQLRPDDQALVVFDGVPPAPPGWLVDSGASVLSTGHRQGPAAARNLAAAQARGDLLVFVDADVQLHPDSLNLIRRHFAADSGLTAVFGSYDDQPASSSLVSRFRNLLHHHTHSAHPGPATTFWAGLGAIRREAFQAVGGFNAAAYERPSIEDIDLGLRLSDAGSRILLDPSIQGTHHKRWTLRSMLVTDIRQRAIPWSRLLLERRELPATLNLTPSARLSAAASLMLFASAPVVLLLPGLRVGALLTLCGSLVLLLALNHSFHRLLVRRTGWLAASGGVLLHAFYLAYASVTFVLVRLFEPFAKRQPSSPLRDGAVGQKI